LIASSAVPLQRCRWHTAMVADQRDPLRRELVRCLRPGWPGSQARSECQSTS
jgi:hypothetical protein